MTCKQNPKTYHITPRRLHKQVQVRREVLERAADHGDRQPVDLVVLRPAGLQRRHATQQVTLGDFRPNVAFQHVLELVQQ